MHPIRGTGVTLFLNHENTSCINCVACYTGGNLSTALGSRDPWGTDIGLSHNSDIWTIFPVCCASFYIHSTIFTYFLLFQSRWLPSMLKVAFRLLLRLHRYILRMKLTGDTAHQGAGATSQLDLLTLKPLSQLVVVDCNQEFPIGQRAELLGAEAFRQSLTSSRV